MAGTSMRIVRLLLVLWCLPGLLLTAQTHEPVEYIRLQHRLAQGWNTWNTHSVLSHVLLPEGLAINITLRSSALGSELYLPNALIGRLERGAEQIIPGPHSYNGSYSELELTWQGNRLRVQSAGDHGDLVLLITPLKTTAVAPAVAFEAGMLWNRPGNVRRSGNELIAHLPHGDVVAYVTGTPHQDAAIPALHPYLALDLDHAVGLSTGRRRSLAEIQMIVQRQRQANRDALKPYGSQSDVVDAIQTVLAWDTVYDPEHDRVITPVSRLWNIHWGGYVLFDWDTFFAAEMAGINNRDLAYANAIEILNEATEHGFVPNFGRSLGWKSEDRSEPPVGSLVVERLYNRYHDRWFLAAAFPELLRWNRWWDQHRNCQGYLCWGSDPSNKPWEKTDSSVHTLQGARFESGLDNSPMYDDVGFDPKADQMQLADVGLMSLYVADCDSLARIAAQLGKTAEAAELRQRGERYRAKLKTLWDPATGIFRNRDLRTGAFSPRLSPTNFYPLLAHAASGQQAERMVREHLENPQEFGGTWVIPSAPRDDPAFKDQNYWRGRIWGPMNFLVYLGLRNYNLAQAQADLARKSEALFFKEWHDHGHVHENYNAITGTGDDVKNSDRFYHWGALLGLIAWLQARR